MSEPARSGAGLEWVRGIWTRRKWFAVATFLLVVAAVLGLARSLPDVYRASTTVLVERHHVPEAFVRSSVTGELETRLHTISQKILSRGRLEALISRFGLYPELTRRAAMEAAVERMRRDIRLELKGVEQMSGRGATIAFTLSYRGRDAVTVAEVTNTLASFYVEENMRLREQQASSTTEFLKVQLADMKHRLTEQEQRVRGFRSRHVGELPQQMAVNLVTLERLHAQLHVAGANLLRAMDRRTTLARQLAEAEQAGGERPETTATKLAKLRQELAELRRQYHDKYPDVIRTKTEIAALERELAHPTPEAPASRASGDPSVDALRGSLDDVEAEIEVLKSEQQRLRRDIDAYQRRVESAPAREQEFQELSRDYDMTRELYASLLKRYEDAQLAESMEQRQRGEQFRVIDPALPPLQPSGPNRAALLQIGLAGALALAVAAMVVAEQLDTSFHTLDDLRAFTDAPVLVSIPLVVTAAARQRRRWRLSLAALAFVLALGGVVRVTQYLAAGNDQLVALLSRGGS